MIILMIFRLVPIAGFKSIREDFHSVRYMLTDADMARFWAKVEQGPGCWTWHGTFYSGKTTQNRPAFWLSSVGNNVLAYRIAYSLCVGDIPEDKELDHAVCDNPRCVNPGHLKLTNARENVLRSRCATAINVKKRVCKRGHPLVPWSKSGKNAHQPWRKCHICAMEAQRRRRAMKRPPLAQSSQTTP